MCHVLIIEDDFIAASDIEATLSREGATSFSFADTEREAVLSARARRPAVITSDVMLASGSGPAAVQAILLELGMLPVIFITATPDQCVAAHAHIVLEKPFNTSHLAIAFRGVLHPVEAAAPLRP